MPDTKNEDIVARYFDIVQDKIKKLISEDNEIKPEQVQQFNDEIFNQPEEIEGQMKNYINKATMNDLDMDKVAKIIYDKFKLQVKNNIFNQKDTQPVPNPMIGERKFIKTFEQWTTDVAGGLNVKYNDESKISEIVEKTEAFIEDNFDNIIDINDEHIGFVESVSPMQINLRKEKTFCYIQFYDPSEKFSTFKEVDITEDEFFYLTKFFLSILNRYREKEQTDDKEKLFQLIDPVRRDAKKYNI